MTLEDCTDYIIVKMTEGGSTLNLPKLQKLVYYAQAWFFAFYGAPLFTSTFEAWIHGPVSRELHERFRGTHQFYSLVTAADARPDYDGRSVRVDEARHIDEVLETYGGLTGTQLEELSRGESPWIEARGSLSPSSPCTTAIEEAVMTTFYRGLGARD